LTDSLQGNTSFQDLRNDDNPRARQHRDAATPGCAFKGAAGYDAKTALALPREELARLNVRHASVTGAQKRLYREFANTGAKLTWEEVERIETEALVHGGLNSDVARATVKQAIDALKNAGVPGPARIPWGN